MAAKSSSRNPNKKSELTQCLSEADARRSEADADADAIYESAVAAADDQLQNNIDGAARRNRAEVAQCAADFDGAIDPQGLKACLDEVRTNYDAELSNARAAFARERGAAQNERDARKAAANVAHINDRAECDFLYGDGETVVVMSSEK